MNLKTFVAAVLAAACTAGAHGAVFNTAQFVNVGNGLVGLDGFGRGASNRPAGTFESQPSANEFFLDTWNINVRGIAPGLYSFNAMRVNAFGGVVFNVVTFNSYDAAGVRNTVLFGTNTAGTQATGSGTFTVLQRCPVLSCVWIDVVGTQPIGGGGGYGGTTVATVVPEPARLALMAVGMAAVAGFAERRRSSNHHRASIIRLG